MSKLFSVLVLIGLIWTESMNAQQLIHGSPVPPLSLQSMVRDADRIVIGDVKTVQERMENKTLDGKKGPLLILRTKLAAVETLKGVPAFEIIQYAPLNIGRVLGSRFLLFLGAPTALGIDPILGKFAGDFEIIDSADHYSVAINRDNNQGLWGRGPLWSEGVSRSAVADELRLLQVPDKNLEEILSHGDKGNPQGFLPLDFIRAVVRAQLKVKP